MTELSSLVEEKEIFLNGIINETKKNIELKLSKKNKKINLLKLKSLKKTYFLILKERTNLRLNRKIIKNIKQSINDYSKFNVKLEDLDAIKLIISQVETKEKKIMSLENKNKEISQENIEFSNTIEKNEQVILELNSLNNKLNENIDNLRKTVISKEEEINKQTDNNKALEKTIFELEGIKKIQYETIYNLKTDIKKRDEELTCLKNESRELVNEFNKILEIVE